MKKVIAIFVITGCFALAACNTNKPAEEVQDAKERVNKKVEDARSDQEKAAEETGEAAPEE